MGALGIRVNSRGALRSGPSLVVANGGGWLDALVLSAASPMLPVTAAQVSGWPVVGPLAVRAGAVVLSADRRGLPTSVSHMTTMLRRGHRVQVFPEAMSGRGGALNPFHRAAFQAAVDAAVVISPVALDYSAPGRPPAGVAGFGGLVRALWPLVSTGPTTVRVHWLPVIPAIAGAGHLSRSRALAARRAEGAISRALGRQVAGGGRAGSTGARPGGDATVGEQSPSAAIVRLPRGEIPGNPDRVPRVA